MAERTNPQPHECLAPGHCPTRRRLLGSAAATLAAAATPPVFATGRDDDPGRAPPQPGDILHYPSWDFERRAVAPDDLVVDAAPLTVFPVDAVAGIARERSRLNQLLLVRFAADGLDERTRGLAADGIVAYSGICTHTACAVSEWAAAQGHFICPCHASEFDPREHGKVVNGPAPRALPMLPIRIDSGTIVVDGGFTATPGARNV